MYTPVKVGDYINELLLGLTSEEYEDAYIDKCLQFQNSPIIYECDMFFVVEFNNKYLVAYTDVADGNPYEAIAYVIVFDELKDIFGYFLNPYAKEKDEATN